MVDRTPFFLFSIPFCLLLFSIAVMYRIYSIMFCLKATKVFLKVVNLKSIQYFAVWELQKFLLKAFTISTIIIPSWMVVVTTSSAIKIVALGIIVFIITPWICSPIWGGTSSHWVSVPNMTKVLFTKLTPTLIFSWLK